MADLESTLDYSLRVELAAHSVFTGHALVYLKKYISVLVKVKIMQLIYIIIFLSKMVIYLKMTIKMRRWSFELRKHRVRSILKKICLLKRIIGLKTDSKNELFDVVTASCR